MPGAGSRGQASGCSIQKSTVHGATRRKNHKHFSVPGFRAPERPLSHPMVIENLLMQFADDEAVCVA